MFPVIVCALYIYTYTHTTHTQDSPKAKEIDEMMHQLSTEETSTVFEFERVK